MRQNSKKIKAVERNREAGEGRIWRKSIVADLPVSCPLSCVNIFGRHRVDAGKRVGVCDCPVCQPQSIRHLSVRARVFLTHTQSHMHACAFGAGLLFFCSPRLLLSPTIGRKEKKRGGAIRERDNADARSLRRISRSEWPECTWKIDRELARHWTFEMSYSRTKRGNDEKGERKRKKRRCELFFLSWRNTISHISDIVLWKICYQYIFKILIKYKLKKKGKLYA